MTDTGHTETKKGAGCVFSRFSSQVTKSTLFILQQLVVKDFKLKYRRSVLGVVWSVLNPLLMMAVLTLVFSNMFRFDIEHYPLYLILGTTLFSLVSDATTNAMGSIIGAAALLKKVRINKEVFPIEKVIFAFVNFALSLVAVTIVLIVMGVRPTVNMLLLPLLLVYVFFFTIGLGLLLSALSVFFRDVMHLWGVIVLAWNYLTPVFWPESAIQMLDPSISGLLIAVEQFNPLYYFVGYFRQIFMYGTTPDLATNLICLAFAAVTFVVGLIVFRKTQNKFILYI